MIIKNRKMGLTAQALVEVALTLPLILLLILGAMDFGRMFFTKLVLTNAAREGANYLAYYPDDKDDSYTVTHATVITEANSSGVSVIDSEIFIPADGEDGDCCTVGEAVEIRIVKTVPLIFGGFLEAVGIMEENTMDITGKVRMVVQR